jgi:hypothetical protein
MEVIDIGLDDLEPITLNNDVPMKLSSAPLSGDDSVNFGAGLELLMNDKKRNSANNVNIDLSDLDKLEKDLNEYAGVSNPSQGESAASSSTSFLDSTTKTLSGFTNMFGFGGSKEETASSSKNVSFDKGSTYEASDSKLGQSTASNLGTSKTWDGFTKVGDIPPEHLGGMSYNMTDKEKRRKKREMIRKLDEWYDKGLIKNSSRFNMDSNFEEVEDEYESAIEDKRKKESVKLYGWWTMTIINSLEYANSAFDPFGLNLDGWGEQVSEEMDSYEEIFGELHEKYKGGKLAPEIALLLKLGLSAAVLNFTNKALSSAAPGFNDVIKQSPELMKMFTDATAKSMSGTSPGFAFASNMMNSPEQINTSFGPPPKAVDTKSSMRSMQFTEPPTNRPDLSMGRGAMFREQGVELNDYSSVNGPSAGAPKPMAPHLQKRVEPQIPAQSQAQQFFRQPPQIPTGKPEMPNARPEMRGPGTDIDNILSGLKTKSVNIHESSGLEDDSMISISSLKDMQNTNMPKRTNRKKNGSNKNTISLDL